MIFLSVFFINYYEKTDDFIESIFSLKKFIDFDLSLQFFRNRIIFYSRNNFTALFNRQILIFFEIENKKEYYFLFYDIIIYGKDEKIYKFNIKYL